MSRNSHPILDGSNYAYWKARTRALLKSKDERVWRSVVVGYTLPSISCTKDGVTTTTSKPIEQWTQDEINLSNWNNQALYTIQDYVDQDEFKLIQICESAKEAWTILENRFEGNTSVKNSKVQRLTTEFELIRMSETETFDQFHKRLRHIVNTLDNLGEKIQENRVVKKILRSLPDKFVPKITAIEESRDLNILTEVDLVGSLQLFEADLISRSSNNNTSKKEKSIALKTVNNQSESDNDSDEFDEDDIVVLTKKFIRYLEKKSKNRSNSNKIKGYKNKKFKQLQYKSKNTSGAKFQGNKEESNSTNANQCWECQGFGHLSFECANTLSKKRRAHKASQSHQTLSDDESNDEEESDSDEEHYTALVGSHRKKSSKKVQNVKSDTSDEEDDDEEFDCIEDAYRALCKEFVKVNKKNEQLKITLATYDKRLFDHDKCEEIKAKLKSEKDALLVTLSENQSEKEVLLTQNEKLQATITHFGEENELLKSRINELNGELEKAKFVKVDLENRSSQLDKILLGPVRFHKDKSGLGYDKYAPSTSNAPPKMVKAQIEPQPTQKANAFIDRTPKAYIKAKALPKVVNQNPKLVQRKVYPQLYFCTYCRKEGHLRDFCYQLGNFKSATHESSYNRLSNLEKHMEYLVSKVFERMLTSQKRYKKRTKKNHNTPNSSIRQSKPRQIWVRKDEQKCCVVETRDNFSTVLPSPTQCIKTPTESLDNHSLEVCLAF